MKWRQVLWIILAVLAGAAFIGLTFAVDVVRREGIEGLWNRKKDAAKTILHGSEKTLEKGERVFDNVVGRSNSLYQPH